MTNNQTVIFYIIWFWTFFILCILNLKKKIPTVNKSRSPVYDGNLYHSVGTGVSLKLRIDKSLLVLKLSLLLQKNPTVKVSFFFDNPPFNDNPHIFLFFHVEIHCSYYQVIVDHKTCHILKTSHICNLKSVFLMETKW